MIYYNKYKYLLFILILFIIFISCNNNIKIDKITLTENGIQYQIEAVSGQVIVIFNDNISSSKAKKYIKQNNGEIINSLSGIRYYLVNTGKGNETDFINKIKTNTNVLYVFLNSIKYPCSPQTHVMDNFYISHGEKVKYAIGECGLKTKITSFNVGIKDNEYGAISNSEIDSDLVSILSKAPKDTPIIINMSFGPSFIDPNINYWTDEDITDIVKNSYRLHYKQELKNLISIASYLPNIDFVIVKSAGNEGVKNLDKEILIDLSRELSDNEFNILNKHYILVGADDNRYPIYSNTVTTGDYNHLYTSVDISDLKYKNENLYGTSFAAPRVACFISTAVNDNNIKATEALQVIKNITFKNLKALNHEVINNEAKLMAEAIKNFELKKKEMKLLENNNSNNNIQNNNKQTQNVNTLPKNTKNRSNSKDIFIGTKWQRDTGATAWLSVVKTEIKFLSNNVVEFHNYFGMGSSEINYMYRYYYHSQSNNWIIYGTRGVSNLIKMSEDEERELAINMGNVYIITINRNKLYLQHVFKKENVEYMRMN